MTVDLKARETQVDVSCDLGCTVMRFQSSKLCSYYMGIVAASLPCCED